MNDREKKYQELKLTKYFNSNFKITNHLKDIYENNIPSFKTGGRLMARRDMGKCIFVVICEGQYQMQVMIKKNNLTCADDFEPISNYAELGDIVGVKGITGSNYNHDKVIIAHELYIISKSLKQLPIKENFKNLELRLRNRYIDTLVNEVSREKFIMRTKIITIIRKFLDNLDYMEVTTPILSSIASGAAAKPFYTHHNSLNCQLSLRIASELYLKRLIVGNFPRVYEIGPNFRNEGLSPRHNPEFTMLEFYQSYGDYWQGMEIVKKLIKTITTELNLPEDNLLNQHFTTISWQELVKTQLQITEINSEKVREVAKIHDFNDDNLSNQELAFIFFDKVLSEKLKNPTFIIDYPSSVSPLAIGVNGIAERAELFINGMEIANLYSELNDSHMQEIAFKEQNEVMIDYDYIDCLAYGMPPCVGVGIGIDRLVMLATNSTSIKEVILFPILKTTNK